MEHHGTSWDEECGKMILWKAVSTAIHQKSNYVPAKNPECRTTNTPYLKVVGIRKVSVDSSRERSHNFSAWNVWTNDRREREGERSSKNGTIERRKGIAKE
jgi:hypothetical protein